jgi:excisionase family DNA binding protein
MTAKMTTNKTEPVVESERRWLRYRDAGEGLGISSEAVRMMVRRGQLPYASIGKRIFIDRLDLERMLVGSKTIAGCVSVRPS